MALFQNIKTLSFEAGADLSALLNHFLVLDTNGRVIVAPTTITTPPIGTLAEAPAALLAGQTIAEERPTIPVAMLNGGGVMKVISDGTTTIDGGDLIVPSDTVAGRVEGVANIAALAAGAVVLGVAVAGAANTAGAVLTMAPAFYIHTV